MPRAKCRAPAKALRDKVGRVVFAFGAVGHRVPHRRLSAKTALQQRRGPDQDNAPALSWATWGGGLNYALRHVQQVLATMFWHSFRSHLSASNRAAG